MKFAENLAEAVSSDETNNSISDFQLGPKSSRNFENMAKFPNSLIGRPGELIITYKLSDFCTVFTGKKGIKNQLYLRVNNCIFSSKFF